MAMADPFWFLHKFYLFHYLRISCSTVLNGFYYAQIMAGRNCQDLALLEGGKRGGGVLVS